MTTKRRDDPLEQCSDRREIIWVSGRQPIANDAHSKGNVPQIQQETEGKTHTFAEPPNPAAVVILRNTCNLLNSEMEAKLKEEEEE